MKRFFNGQRAALGFTLAAAALSASAAPVAINLSTWQERGPAANGNWVVAAGGDSVRQTINNDPTFFVSGVSQVNTTLRGRIRVETSGDDDFVGFVFGFQGPAATGNDMDFLLFDWKQGTQAFGGATAQAGFALSRVQGTITDYLPGFWGHIDSPVFDVLATRYGATEGWQDNVEYEFAMLYQTGRIKIDIAGGNFGAGTTVLDVAGNFNAGSFGFYNYSQAGVRYSGLTEEASPPPPPPPPPGSVPEPAALSLAVLAAGLGATARRQRIKG